LRLCWVLVDSLLQGFPVHGKRDGACSQAFQGLRRFWNYLTVKLPIALMALIIDKNRNNLI